MLYLDKVAHVAIPWIVSEVQRAVGNPADVTLIGACEWSSYLSVPLTTEDVDLVSLI